MMLSLPQLVIVSCSLLMLGCQSSGDSTSTQQKATTETTSSVNAEERKAQQITPQQKKEEHELHWQQAKVTFLSFEGGFYGLVTESGEKLLPMNLAKAYQVNGSIVKVAGEKLSGVITTRMWGTPFKINQIKLIKDGNALPHPQG